MNSPGKPHPRQIYCRTLISPLSVLSSFFQTHCFQLAAEIGPAAAASPFVPGLPLAPLAPLGPIFPGDPTSPWEPFAPSAPSPPRSPLDPGLPWSPRGPWGPGVPGTPGMPFAPGIPGIPPANRPVKTWIARETVLLAWQRIEVSGPQTSSFRFWDVITLPLHRCTTGVQSGNTNFFPIWRINGLSYSRPH